MSDILEDKMTNEEKQVNNYFEDNLIYEPRVFSTEQTIEETENADLTTNKDESHETIENDSSENIELPSTQETPKTDYVEIQVFFNRSEPGISFRDCTNEVPNELKNGSSDDVFYTRVASIDETFWNDEKNNENESVIANDGNGGRRTVVTYMVSQEKMETIVETIQEAVERHDAFVCLDVKTILLTKKMPSIADDFNHRNSQYDSLRKEIADIIEKSTSNEIEENPMFVPQADFSQPETNEQSTDLPSVEKESDDNDFDPNRIIAELKKAADDNHLENETFENQPANNDEEKQPTYFNPDSSTGMTFDFQSDPKTPEYNSENAKPQEVNSDSDFSPKNSFELNENEKKLNEEIMNQINSIDTNSSATSMSLTDYYDSMNNNTDLHDEESFKK